MDYRRHLPSKKLFSSRPEAEQLINTITSFWFGPALSGSVSGVRGSPACCRVPCAVGVGGLVGAFCLSLVWSHVCGTGGRAGGLNQRSFCTTPRCLGGRLLVPFWFGTALSGGIASRRNRIFACALFCHDGGIRYTQTYI